VREYLGAAGFSIDAELAEAITSGLSGDGLGRLRAELDKLMSAAGTPRAIGPADLELLASVPRVDDAFLLARQILNGDRGAAVNSLRLLLAAGEEPVMLLGGISWYFRNALKARAARDRRVPPREVGARYGIDPGRVERFGREVGRIGEGDLEAALRHCAAADSELKGRGARDPAHAFERLIHRIGLGSRGAH
jgi:DNA polymerase III delta subunit